MGRKSSCAVPRSTVILYLEAITLVSNWLIDFKKMVPHQFQLEDAIEAINIIAANRVQRKSE